MAIHPYDKVLLVEDGNYTLNFFKEGAEEYLKNKGYARHQIVNILCLGCPRHLPILFELIRDVGLQNEGDLKTHYVRRGPYAVCSDEYYEGICINPGDSISMCCDSSVVPPEFTPGCAEEPPSPHVDVKDVCMGALVAEAQASAFVRFLTDEAQLKEEIYRALLFTHDEQSVTLSFEYENHNGDAVEASVVLPTTPFELSDAAWVKSHYFDDPVGTKLFSVHYYGYADSTSAERLDAWRDTCSRLLKWVTCL